MSLWAQQIPSTPRDAVHLSKKFLHFGYVVTNGHGFVGDEEHRTRAQNRKKSLKTACRNTMGVSSTAPAPFPRAMARLRLLEEIGGGLADLS